MINIEFISYRSHLSLMLHVGVPGLQGPKGEKGSKGDRGEFVKNIIIDKKSTSNSVCFLNVLHLNLVSVF